VTRIEDRRSLLVYSLTPKGDRIVRKRKKKRR
jgi:hypothetical protein